MREVIVSPGEGRYGLPCRSFHSVTPCFTAIFHTLNTGDAVLLLDGLAPKRGCTAERLSRDQDDFSFPG